MEITRYFEEYKKHSTEEFYNWFSEGKTIEVRFLSDKYGKKFVNYDLIRLIGKQIGAEFRFTSLYINNYKQLKEILLYKFLGYPVTKLFNIFIGVNPRRKVYTKSKNGLLKKTYYGGIAGTECIQNILCDIEHEGKRVGNATEEMIEECIDGAKYLVKILEIDNYYINISGNGVHLWFKLEKAIDIPVPSFTEFPDKVKYNLKEDKVYKLIKTYNAFIEKLDKYIKEYNKNLKVDEGAKDIARIARPPGSWNVKAKKKARAVGTVLKNNKNNKYKNIKFLAVNPILNKEIKGYVEKKKLTKNHRYNAKNLENAPIVKLLLSGYLPSTLSRNHYLEQSLARLIRDNEIELHEIDNLIMRINEVQRKDIQIDPDYLDGDESFNSETVNAYCYGCRVDFVYDIMEDVPEIQENYIDEKRYKTLNNISDKALDKLAIEIPEINSYLELKSVIRKLIDNDISQATIFFSLKKYFKDEWDYFHRNKIISQILNKTRRMKNEIK